MRITTETRNGVAVLTLSGRLIFDDSLLSLREHVRRLLDAGLRRFIMDLSEVSHCDSSGCGEIIGAYASITKAGGAVAFLKPAERVRVLWTRIKLREVFSIFDTLPEAETFVRR